MMKPSRCHRAARRTHARPHTSTRHGRFRCSRFGVVRHDAEQERDQSLPTRSECEVQKRKKKMMMMMAKKKGSEGFAHHEEVAQ